MLNNIYKNFPNLLIVILLLSGFVLTLTGFSDHSLRASIPWSSVYAPLRFLAFEVSTAFFVLLIAKKLHQNVVLVTFIASVLLILAVGALWPFLVSIWFAIASVTLGRWFMQKLNILDASLLISFLAGAGLYGTAVGLLAHFPLNYPGIYGIALALPIALNWRSFVKKSGHLFNYYAASSSQIIKIKKLDIAIIFLVLFYIAIALMPEIGFDALAMHLFVPAHLAQRHQWGFDASTYVWAVMPMLGDWIFSIVYMLGGEAASRLINVGFIIILGCLVRELVLWAGGSYLGARWAVLIFLSTPLTFTEGSSLFIDSIWASFFIAGAWACLNACSTSDKPREFMVAGVLLGFSMAAKAVTFTTLPVLLFLMAYQFKLWFKINCWLLYVLGFVLFLAIGIIPYATAWHLTSNPFFPLYNNIFQSPFYLTDANFTNSHFLAGLTWDVIYRATFESRKYLEGGLGSPGFQWMLVFVPASVTLLFLGKRRGITLLFLGLAFIGLVFHFQSYLRYIFPASIILVAAIGVALSEVLSSNRFMRSIWYFTVMFVVILNLLFFVAGSEYKKFSLSSIIDQSGRESYLQIAQPIRNAVELVNRLNVSGAPVAVFASPLAAGLSADAIYPNWYNHKFQIAVDSVGLFFEGKASTAINLKHNLKPDSAGYIITDRTEQDLVDALIKRNVEYIILDTNWNGENCCPWGPTGGKKKQALVEKITEKIADVGSMSVRKIRPEYRFKTELLRSSNFSTVEGWSLTPGVKHDTAAGKVIVNVNSVVFQEVVISPGARYRNTVVARCAIEQTLGRVQVNWMDAKKQFIGANIRNFECSRNWAEHSMDVMAPANAVTAVIYTSGQSATPLEFKSNSLLQ